MPQVDPVILQLKADVDKYQADVAGAARLTDEKLSQIEAKGLAMGEGLRKGFSAAKTAALAYAASIGVTEITHAISAGLEYASSLGEQAQQLGVTSDALQEYRYAATQVGLSAEEMDQALSQLTRRIGEGANGTKAQAEAFEKLGISLKDANGHVIDAGAAIPLIADALQKIESPAERAAILMDLFGRAGQKLEPLLSGGSAGVNELRDAAHRLGIVLDGNLIKNADDAADKLSALKAVLSARIAGAVAENANSILQLAGALGTLVDFVGRADAAYRNFQQSFRAFVAQQKTMRGLTEGVRAEGAREMRDIALQRQSDQIDANTRKAFGGLTVADFASRGAPAAAGVPTVKVPKGGGGGGGGGGGRSGPSLEEIAHRFDAERAQLMGQYNQAMASMARSAEEEAEYELRAVELARIRSIADIEADKHFSAAQKAQLSASVEQIAEAERDRVEFQRKRRVEQEAQGVADAEYKAKAEALQNQLDLSDTQAERRRIALQMLDLEYQYQKALLEAILASQTATEADKQRARIALDGLNSAEPGKVDRVTRDNAGPLDQYLRRTDPAKNGERAEQLVVDELDHVHKSITNAITDALGVGDDPLITGLIDMLLEQILFRPLAEALQSGASGGGGGLLGGLLSGIGHLFGFASGGYTAGGRAIRVNEGASPGRVEGFIPQGAGHIIPLGRMNALAGGGGGGQPAVVQIHVMEGQMFEPRVHAISGNVSVQVVRASAPSLIDASARETTARLQRPRI